MGASVCSLTSIKSTIHVGASLGLSPWGGGVLDKGLQLSTKFVKFLKTRA